MTIWPCCIIGQGQSRVIIWANLVVLKHPMMHTKFQDNWPSGSREDFLRSLAYIWAWQPSWSCDQDHLSKLSFTHPTEAPYEIWLWVAQWFQRRYLKSVDDDVMRTTEVYLSYKLTKSAFGSGELISNIDHNKIYTNLSILHKQPVEQIKSLRKRLSICSVISVNYHYITALCPFN